MLELPFKEIMYVNKRQFEENNKNLFLCYQLNMAEVKYGGRKEKRFIGKNSARYTI